MTIPALITQAARAIASTGRGSCVELNPRRRRPTVSPSLRVRQVLNIALSIQEHRQRCLDLSCHSSKSATGQVLGSSFLLRQVRLGPGNGPKPPVRFVLPSACADHPSCTAVFCSPRRGRCGFAFPCFALPRRHCSTARPTLDCQPKCLDDQPLGRFLSLLRFPDLLLARDSLSICSDWYVFWSPSRLAWFGDDPLGKPTGRTFLHSEPLAGASRRAGNRSTFCLRLVARHALRQQRSRRATLANDRLRNGAFPGGGRRVNSLLSRLLHWSASANHASRATARQLKRITDCRSYTVDFVAALFRLRGRFRDFEAAPLRTAEIFCSCSEADAARRRRSLRPLRSCFSCK